MSVHVRCSNPSCTVTLWVDDAELRRLEPCRSCQSSLVLEDGSDPNATDSKFVPISFPSIAIAIGPSLRSPFGPGMVIDARYEIVRSLGDGAMGNVFLAFDHKLLRQTAIKVPLKVHEPATLLRFAREAQSAARLDHPNIGPIHNVGKFGDYPYIDMKLIDGFSLAGHLKKQAAPHDLVEAAKLVAIVARAVHSAHAKGIIHRDLKPGNIMIRIDGQPIVMDFGLAKTPDARDSLISSHGDVLGTPAYMSIEQFDPKNHPPIDHRCDIYSLGVILYELITGRLPFAGSPTAIGIALMQYLFDRPTSLRPDLDFVLEEICLKAMAQLREDRYASMEEFAEALDGWTKGGPPPALPWAPATKRIVSAVTGMELTLIPRGRFLMGSEIHPAEMPIHEVSISRAFYLGVHPVTHGEYAKLTTNPSVFTGDARRPVESVSWFDALRFCNALSEAETFTPFYTIRGQSVAVPDWDGEGYRLPTEAEWEYACRARSIGHFCFGDDEATLGDYAWFNKNPGETHPVGRKRANAWGLHDMHGNVWEWCWDAHDSGHYAKRIPPVIDPRGPSDATFRVVRGGFWGSLPRRARSADRGRGAAKAGYDNVGFRLARVPSV